MQFFGSFLKRLTCFPRRLRHKVSIINGSRSSRRFLSFQTAKQRNLWIKLMESIGWYTTRCKSAGVLGNISVLWWEIVKHTIRNLLLLRFGLVGHHHLHNSNTCISLSRRRNIIFNIFKRLRSRNFDSKQSLKMQIPIQFFSHFAFHGSLKISSLLRRWMMTVINFVSSSQMSDVDYF